MPSLEDTFAAINTLKADGVIADYAVAGAMALVFWTEPVATFDLDVLVEMAARALVNEILERHGLSL